MEVLERSIEVGEEKCLLLEQVLKDLVLEDLCFCEGFVNSTLNDAIRLVERIADDLFLFVLDSPNLLQQVIGFLLCLFNHLFGRLFHFLNALAFEFDMWGVKPVEDSSLRLLRWASEQP